MLGEKGTEAASQTGREWGGVGWGWNSNAFLTGDPRQWGQPLTQDQALKTPGQVTLVQVQP